MIPKGFIKDFAIGVLFLASVFGVGYLTGSHCSLKRPIPPPIEKTDTLTIYKNSVHLKPISTNSEILNLRIPVLPQFLVFTDSVKVTDTIWLPRERKVYEDSTYRAVVSGYQPSLDEIDIFTQERIIYNDRVVQVPRNDSRWSVGLTAGVGATIAGGKVIASPALVLGVQYNFWTFKKRK